MAYVGAEVGVSILTVLSHEVEPAAAYSVPVPEQATDTFAVPSTVQYEFMGQIMYLSSGPQVYAKPPVVSATLTLSPSQATPALVQSLAWVDPRGDSSLPLQATAAAPPVQYESTGQMTHLELTRSQY